MTGTAPSIMASQCRCVSRPLPRGHTTYLHLRTYWSHSCTREQTIVVRVMMVTHTEAVSSIQRWKGSIFHLKNSEDGLFTHSVSHERRWARATGTNDVHTLGKVLEALLITRANHCVQSHDGHTHRGSIFYSKMEIPTDK